MKYLLFTLLFFPVSTFASFNTNLSYGAKGDSVIELQEFLADKGFYTGPITGNFYALTRSAVSAFQTKYGISPASGFFGVLTRNKVNSLLSLTQEETVTPVPKNTLSELAAKIVLLQEQLNQLNKKVVVQTQPVIQKTPPSVVAITPLNTKPTISVFSAVDGKAKIGVPGKITYRAENAITCVVNETKNVSVPFTGNLPQGEVTAEFRKEVFVDGFFTYYLICADKDWNTVTQTLKVPLDTFIDKIQPTKFFSASGNDNIGNGGNGNKDGTPYVLISSPLKQGVSMILEMDGKKYFTDGNYFYFDDLYRDPKGQYAGTCTLHSYIVKLFYQDSVNGLITGQTEPGSFCLNDLK